MPTFKPDQLAEICTRIFDAAGSPHAESVIVSEILVRSSLMGHDSHGVLRVPQYVEAIEAGEIKPGAKFEIVRQSAASALVEANQGWGMVAARQAMLLAIEKARQATVGLVLVRGSQHIGRVGEYPSMAAAAGMIGMAVVNSYGSPPTVAPWGGLDGRLAPNPLAVAVPSGGEWPILVDITSSAIPEGKVRVARYEGKPLPEGSALDAAGNPTTDPAAFYGPPRGALLPLGGPVGHKGYGLGLVADLLGGVLTGVGYSGQAVQGRGNGVFFQAINIEAFAPLEEFTQTVQEQIAWIKSARRAPGVEEILIPGEVEQRTAQRRSAEGIRLPDSVWDDIGAVAARLGVAY